jgi:hypothetical protein
MRSKSEALVKRRVFGKANKRALRTSIIDLTIHDRTDDLCRTGKVFPRKRSQEDSLQANDEPGLWRRRRIHIDVGLRLGLRLGLSRWRFFYDRGFFLLGWRIGDCGFFLLTGHEHCGTGKDDNVFFHNVGTKWKRLRRW